jgi:hypothetical protein
VHAAANAARDLRSQHLREESREYRLDKGRELWRFGQSMDESYARSAACVVPIGPHKRCGLAVGALSSLCMMASLTYSCFALASSPANPTISGVIFTGKNIDLAVTISGTGFGTAPKGVPCTKCTTPYLKITDGRGYGCQIFNVKSWTDTGIAFTGFQGNPGDSVLILVKNPQTNLVGIRGQINIPAAITLASPAIKTVVFSGEIGRHLEMTIMGSGFGASPSGLPFNGNLANLFSFIDKPFMPGEWQAGYGIDAVTLTYGSWSNDRIVILGFVGSYGTSYWKVDPNDPVEIAVANSGTCGLGVNAIDQSLGPTFIGAVWLGHLP